MTVFDPNFDLGLWASPSTEQAWMVARIALENHE